MSDKQRMAHNLAKYWEGPLTRAEGQKVFDETAQVIKHHQEIITKLDMVMAFLVEKSGSTTEEIQAWMNDRVKQMQAAAEEEAQKAAAQPPQEAPQAEGSVVLA